MDFFALLQYLLAGVVAIAAIFVGSLLVIGIFLALHEWITDPYGSRKLK